MRSSVVIAFLCALCVARSAPETHCTGTLCLDAACICAACHVPVQSLSVMAAYFAYVGTALLRTGRTASGAVHIALFVLYVGARLVVPSEHFVLDDNVTGRWKFVFCDLLTVK